jgi:peptidoglycan hydrolase-like protein with peptidoglycan-binding domain
VPRASRVDFALNVGVVVPSHVHVVSIRTFPALIEIFPQFRDDEFFVADDDIVVLDRSRHVVDVVPAGPRSRFSQAAPSGGGPAVALNLSGDDIREVQQVLIDQGFLVGEVTGVLDARTHDAIIAFQRPKGIQVTGSIDVQTVSSLGLSGRIGQGTTGAASTNGQGSVGTQQPGQGNNMSGQQASPQNPSTNGQAAPPQNMGSQGANQPNTQMAPQNRSTTGQAPSGGMQPQPPAQNQPMQNQPSGQGNTQPAAPAPAPQNQNRPSR